jgi:hypothetical protein
VPRDVLELERSHLRDEGEVIGRVVLAMVVGQRTGRAEGAVETVELLLGEAFGACCTRGLDRGLGTVHMVARRGAAAHHRRRLVQIERDGVPAEVVDVRPQVADLRVCSEEARLRLGGCGRVTRLDGAAAGVLPQRALIAVPVRASLAQASRGLHVQRRVCGSCRFC